MDKTFASKHCCNKKVHPIKQQEGVAANLPLHITAVLVVTVKSMLHAAIVALWTFSMISE
ncbi:MAG TPA: hypothetical protein VER14_09315 [Phototrophicaceae bacterium]|nr:hypothetical protein [Phototrophicaceae bacterium]